MIAATSCICLFQAYTLGRLKDPSNRWKSLTVVGGIYLFFMLEYVMKMFIRYKEGGYGKTENVSAHYLALQKSCRVTMFPRSVGFYRLFGTTSWKRINMHAKIHY